MILDEVLTPREIKAVEMNAEYLGVSMLQLMENAGKAVADVVIERFETKSDVSIVCGLGGNGGDGLVAARHLVGAGFSPKVILVGRPELISSKETRKNWEILRLMTDSISLNIIKDSKEITPFFDDVIVDALVGTGVSGSLSSPYSDMVDAINATKGYKIAVDVPSGIETETGKMLGPAVIADLTITFHKEKTGFKNATSHTGQLLIRPIGIPPEAEIQTGPGDVYLASKKRPPNAYKGMFGRVLVIGGSETYSGAPALTALASYATGVDLVYVAAPETVSTVIAGFSPSLITLKLKGSRLTPKHLEKLGIFFDNVDAVVIGPGLGLHEKTEEAVMTILADLEKRKIPLLIDADALKMYPRDRGITTNAIFTPHRKEFEILTGKSIEENLSIDGETVRNEAERLRATILLKGHIDVISDGEKIRYNRTGNPGMTVGGTGDVLVGIAAGFMANKIKPMQAACAAAFINGAAGDESYEEKGYHIEPMDLVRKTPKIVEDALSRRQKYFYY